ncbi:MAG: hypothetical protein GX626_07280 [Spirochaetales bacterium]|nr:hypothetical protein [Spirochaetales bacterium]
MPEQEDQSYRHEAKANIDYSGLVINIYQEDRERYGLNLAFSTITSTGFIALYTKPIQVSSCGDSIFMNEEQDIIYVPSFINPSIQTLHFSICTQEFTCRYPASSLQNKGFGRLPGYSILVFRTQFPL